MKNKYVNIFYGKEALSKRTAINNCSDAHTLIRVSCKIPTGYKNIEIFEYLAHFYKYSYNSATTDHIFQEISRNEAQNIVDTCGLIDTDVCFGGF